MADLIGALKIALTADTAQFTTQMRKAKGEAAGTAVAIQKSFGMLKAGLVGLAGGLSIGMFTQAVKAGLEYAGSLGEVAAQLGVTTKELQTFRFAAQQNGASLEEADKSLGKFSISVSKALSGSSQMQKAFAAVGVTLDDLRTKSKTDLIGQIGDAMIKTGGASANAAAGVALFGKGFQKIIPLLDQGSSGINGLAAAAEELGIVLSDEQIEKADETADKLDALKTVLAANIAGVVADNSDAILGFADSLSTLVTWLGTALRSYQAFVAGMTIARGMLNQLNKDAGVRAEGRVQEAVGGANLRDLQNQEAGGSSAADRARRFRKGLGMGVAAPQPTPNPDQFLAKGGGGGGHKKKGGGGDPTREAKDKLRDEYDFSSDMRRAEMDILRAKQDLADDYEVRAHFSIQQLDLEHESHEAEMQYQTAVYKLTGGKEGLSEAQADQLRIAYDIKDGLERQKINIDTENERQEQLQKVVEGDFERQRSILESQDAIATTAEERRKVELEILRLAYEQKRQALEHVLATSKDGAELINAQRDLANLDATYGNERQGVLASTRGPLEEWGASVPKTAAEINEAFETIASDGLDSLTTALFDVISGTKSLKEAFTDLAQSIVAQILEMTIRMLVFKTISGLVGGLGGIAGGGGSFTPVGSDPSTAFTGIPGFAVGGGFNILGRRGTDRNLLALNGIPIAKVSHGERVNIGRDGSNDGQAKVLIVPTPYFDAHVQGQAAKVAAPMAGSAAVAGASGAMTGMRRQRERTLPG